MIVPQPGTKTGEIHVQRRTKLELVRAVQELERRGWECVAPIKAVEQEDCHVVVAVRWGVKMRRVQG